MIKNKTKVVQLKLNQHRQAGTKSDLSIVQVAELMDALKIADQINNHNNQSIFHSIQLN
jgi:hypothetical protein